VTADPLAMQAAIAQLAGLVTGLQSELHKLTAQVETRPEQTAPPVPLAAQGQGTQAASREVTGKLKPFSYLNPLVVPHSLELRRTSYFIASSISLAWMLQQISRSCSLLVCWRGVLNHGGGTFVRDLRALRILLSCIPGHSSMLSFLRNFEQ
jgi:hypothetical protein